MPKVLIIGPTPPPYHGGAVFTENILHYMIQSEFSLIHLDTRDPRDINNIGKLDCFNIIFAIKHALQFQYLLVIKRPSIVYVPIAPNKLGFLRDSTFLIPAILMRRKVVIHLHGSIFANFYKTSPWWLRILIKTTVSRSSRAIVLCERLKYIFENLVPDNNRIVVVPNGIEIREHIEEPARAKRNKQLILNIGQLSIEKGTMDIIRAIPSIISSNDNITFVLAGTWNNNSTESEAKQFIKENHLDAYVQMPGPVEGEAKQELLRTASIFIHPSHHEGAPYAILEAMMNGLPVVASDVGCIAEMVGDGIGGFVIEKGNIEQFSNKVSLLLEDIELRKTMGRAAYERVRSRFELHQSISRLSNIFIDLLKEKGSSLSTH